MKKRGTGKRSTSSRAKKSSADTKKHISTKLHEMHPRHIRKLIKSVKKGHYIKVKERKKHIKKQQIKQAGFWHYLKHKHNLDFEPLSIRVLITYLLFLGIFNVLNLLAGVKSATAVIFGFTLTGISAFLTHILIIILLLVVAYGIGKRDAWGFDLAIIWFGLGIISSVISAIFLKGLAFEYVRQLTLISSISVVAINSLVIWYLLAQKRYFFEHIEKKKSLEREDRIFVYTIISFWIIVILIGVTLGVRFFRNTTEQTDLLVKELDGKHLWQAMSLCGSKTGTERDLCYVVIATMDGGSSTIEDLQICEKIESDFFKLTCERASS